MKTFSFPFLGFLFLLSTCLSSREVTAQQPAPKHKIAVILPLSGPVAEFGVATRNGFEMALKEHPLLFKNFEFIFDDSQYDSQKALSSFQRFRTDGEVALAYLWGYGPSQSVIPVAEAHKFPVIAITAERSLTAGKKYALRFCYHIEMIADVTLKYLRSKGIKRVGVLKTEIAYMNGLLEQIRKHLKSDESFEVVDNFQFGDTNFRSTLTKLKTKNFDALGVLLAGGQISTFYREMKRLHIALPTFGTDFFDSMKEVTDAQGTMQGAVFGAPLVQDEFVQKYVKQFGNDAQVAWAANGYEFAVLTGSLLRNEPSTLSGEEILQKFKQVSGTKGTAARYSFTDSPEGSGFDFEVTARKVESDKIVNLTF